jgi:hypothetical protein
VDRSEPFVTVDRTAATPWLRAAFGWRRVAALVVGVGFVTRIVTGLCFHALSVERGWSGIVTLLAMYTVMFVTPVGPGEQATPLAAIALGRNRAPGDEPWPGRTRLAIAMTMLVVALPIVVAVATMPGSGRVVDDATGAIVPAVVAAVGLMAIVDRVRAPRRTRERSRRDV